MKKMKKHALIVLAFMIASLPGIAQIQLHESGNSGLMRINIKKSDRLSEVEGSPYLNETYQVGTATVKGKEPLKIFMRYNVPQDQIEIKLDPASEDTYQLPKDSKTVYRVGTQTFVYDQFSFSGSHVTGYFIQHYDGENFRLLEKPVATISEAVKAKTGYDKDRPAQIKIEEEFYVLNKNGQVHNLRLKHKDIKKAFDSETAKKYLNDNKIKDLQDLKSFISYIDKQ